MSDQSKPNGEAPPSDPVAVAPARSLREVAEDAYDEVTGASDDGQDEQLDAPAGQDGRTRDSLGRFAPIAKPGEADGQQADPAPNADQPQPPTPAQPPPGSSSEPPANWSAEDRQTFAKLQPEGQAFLLKRHSEMEGDYQKRVQANAAAAQFTQSLEPIFTDPQIAASLRENNLNAREAITEWASMHRRAISPDMRDRVGLWHEIGQRMGLDPAAVYGQSQSGQQQPLTEADLKDPAIKYFADHASRTAQEVQALRGQITAMQQATAQQANAEAMKVTRWGIDSFAEEKGADGKPLRPDFDAVLPQIIELFNANPNRDLREAYEQARWMHPQTRERLVAAERASVQQQVANQRAKQAGRLNTRGVTSPVSKPADAPGSKTLRDTLEQAADEVGFG